MERRFETADVGAARSRQENRDPWPLEDIESYASLWRTIALCTNAVHVDLTCHNGDAEVHTEPAGHVGLKNNQHGSVLLTSPSHISWCQHRHLLTRRAFLLELVVYNVGKLD